MAKKFSSAAPPPNSPGADDGPHRPQNFLARAKVHSAAHNGEWHVIRSSDSRAPGAPTPAQWSAWLVWFAAHQFDTRWMASHGVFTVPSEWPEEFDLRWAPSARIVGVPSAPIGPQRRLEMLARLKRLSAKMGDVRDPRRPDMPIAALRETADERLSRLVGEYASEPVRASPRLLAILGFDAPHAGVIGEDEDAEIDF